LKKTERAEKGYAVAGNEVASKATVAPLNSAFQSPAKIRANLFASPTKSILITPGTATNRRKTVSFGGLALQSEQSMDGLLDASHGKSQRPASVSMNPDAQRASDGLRRSLFPGVEKAEINTAQIPVAVNDDGGPSTSLAMVHSMEETESTADVTIDLKQPRSRSGQHWKQEYQRDHDKSKVEMRKLIRYSQIAKSYAVKKDAEAMSSGEKLKRSESRLAEMESRISEIAAKLRDSQEHEKGCTNDQDQLMNDLAAQMAQALKYKQRAEKYKLAIQEQNLVASSDSDYHDKPAGSRGRYARSHQIKPKVDSRTLEELESLRSEAGVLQIAVQTAESKAEQLNRENLQLKSSILRVKEEMKKYEGRHNAWEERRKRRDAKAAAQKQVIREQMLQMRMDHQKEIDELKATMGSGKRVGLGRHFTDHGQAAVIKDLRSQLQDLTDKLAASTANTTSSVPSDWQQQQRKMSQELRQAREDLRKCQIEMESAKSVPRHMHQSRQASADETRKHLSHSDTVDIWIPSHRARRPSKSAPASSLHLPNTQPVEPRALTEVTHNSSTDLSSLALGTTKRPPAGIAAPKLSPRQTTVPPSSPPFYSHEPQAPSSSNPNDSARVPRSLRANHGTSVLPSSSRSSSLGWSSRAPLPPDRVAAAKARLQAKRRATEVGKENRVP
jgi:hypothetical protein